MRIKSSPLFSPCLRRLSAPLECLQPNGNLASIIEVPRSRDNGYMPNKVPSWLETNVLKSPAIG
ncbi:MAG: hypothetical protein COV69_00545 [Parcubacteria group bacterium CG11_big_fil_rev_8_21_14_0_20_39_14]|nr:MAG: hypothetical protein COV69_00545 [Parcubacteria group bacterium CG11_big_fil_rev_8_21_14_0_20_39_14]